MQQKESTFRSLIFRSHKTFSLQKQKKTVFQTVNKVCVTLFRTPLLIEQGWATLLAPRATLETRREPRASTSTFRLEQVLIESKQYNFKVIFTINSKFSWFLTYFLYKNSYLNTEIISRVPHLVASRAGYGPRAGRCPGLS